MPEQGYGPHGLFWGGERVMRPVKDPATGEDRWAWFRVHVNRKTGEISFVLEEQV